VKKGADGGKVRFTRRATGNERLQVTHWSTGSLEGEGSPSLRRVKVGKTDPRGPAPGEVMKERELFAQKRIQKEENPLSFT